jgi:pyridinium-3,5-bisthiocarboxylic acid mononucleotide nickel chelatase
MGRLLYFDCFSGISGDMTLASLIDLGADVDYIRTQLRLLPFEPFDMDIVQVDKRGIAAKQLQLKFGQNLNHHDNHINDHHHHDHHHHDHHHHDHHHHDGHHDHAHRKAAEIIHEITQSALPERVKDRSVKIFQAIAEAEGKIHGMDPADVHFHEVGAMDSIIDIVGVCLALEFLGIEEIVSSPVPTGRGKVRMAHGLYPIPAPATAELLRGIPLDDFSAAGELTTPTGAGILKALATRFEPLPAGKIANIGYGAGSKDFDHPNVLRAIIINSLEQENREAVVVLEAQVDDCTGEVLSFAMERLLKAGALDVYFTSIYMKKNRPGVLISVITKLDNADLCERIVLTETSTFGVRRSNWTRRILDRKMITVNTSYGPVRIKQALEAEHVVHQSPEYEDAAQAAREHGVSIMSIFEEAMRCAKQEG